MDAYRFILSKRDLRRYTERAVDREVLVKILDAGRRCGSARNRQPWQFVAVTDRRSLRRLAGCGWFSGHLASAAAAVALVVGGRGDLFDAGRCAQAMMLAAWSFGIASCPVSLHREEEARGLLGLPPGPLLATVLALGYPDPRGRGRAERLALRVIGGRGRKRLEEVVHWEIYGRRPPGAGPRDAAVEE